MLPIRVVRSRCLLEIKLSCNVKKGHIIRTSNFVGPDPPDTPVEKHYVARKGQSFDLIKTKIVNGIGIADILRPSLRVEYAPQKYIYVGVHSLFKAENYQARCRLKVGDQLYKGSPDQ